jgi:hypothetical protein
MTTTNQMIDLRPFCAIGDYGVAKMDEPWVLDGWRYATDGRILVRVPAAGVPNTITIPDHHFPPAQKLFAESPAVEPIPWPTAPLVLKSIECLQCDGSGRIGCEDCDNLERCLVCGGIGYGSLPLYRKVGEHMIAVAHDMIIRSLPNVRWFPGKHYLHPLPFIFDGGEGRQMGLSSNDYTPAPTQKGQGR